VSQGLTSPAATATTQFSFRKVVTSTSVIMSLWHGSVIFLKEYVN
jgi:hypothetical protein